MRQVDVDYLYDIYKDEYSDGLNEELLSREAFIEIVEDIIEDKIRVGEF